MLTKSPSQAPDKAGEVTIGFEGGTPVSVNGKKMSAVALLETLNQIGGEHGIGRIDLVENRFVGMKSRGCYETPGGTLILFAARELEALTLDKGTLHYKQKLALDYAEMVYNGLWFTPLREALDAFFEKVSEPVTGEVKLRLYKGNLEPLSRKSPYSLYSLDIASFTMGASYDQKDALGFINLVGLPIKVRAGLTDKAQAGKAK
jgi:argininosuccinate synthase